MPHDDAATTPQHIPRRHYVLRRLRRGVRRRMGGTQSAILIGSMVMFLLTGVGNSVMFKKSTDVMPNYGWFLAVACSTAFIPIFGACVMVDTFRGIVTPAMQRFPKHRFVLMAFLDAFSCVTAVMGGAFTSGPTQMVLGQTVVPFTLIFSTLFLSHHFHIAQHLGAFVIILGVFAAKLPVFLQGEAANDRVVFNAIYVVGCLASSLSQIYKEVAFQDAALAVNYLQFWVAFYQSFWTVAFAPLNAMKFLGPQRVPLADQLHMLWGGSACLFLGRNTITENCGGAGQPLCDSCAGAGRVVAKYLFFNVLVNIFALVIVKQGGAALSYVVATLRLPLTTLCFYSVAVMGAAAVRPSLFDLLGLMILLGGLAMYRWGAAQLAAAVGTLEPDEGTKSEVFCIPSNGNNEFLGEPFMPPSGGLLDCLGIESPGESCDDEGRDECPVAQMGTVILGNGPFVFTVHGNRRPLYLRPGWGDDSWPTAAACGRRTLHDMRLDSNDSENSLQQVRTTKLQPAAAWTEPGVSIMLEGGLDISLANHRPSPVQ